MPEGEWDKSVLLNFEREMLGLYVSDHPLLGVEHILRTAAEVSIADLQTEAVKDGQMVTVAGILSSVTRRMTKDGKAWAQVILEDLEGSVEVLFFPASYAQVGLQIAEDAIVVINGRVDAREDTIRIIGSDLTPARPHRGPARAGPGHRDQAAVPPRRSIENGCARSCLAPGHHRGAILELTFGQRHVMRLPDHRVTPRRG